MTSNQTLKSACPLCRGASSSFLVRRTKSPFLAHITDVHSHYSKLRLNKASLGSFSVPPHPNTHTVQVWALPAISVNPYPQAHWLGRLRGQGVETGQLDQEILLY